jgi:hypothetical protein
MKLEEIKKTPEKITKNAINTTGLNFFNRRVFVPIIENKL